MPLSDEDYKDIMNMFNNDINSIELTKTRFNARHMLTNIINYSLNRKIKYDDPYSRVLTQLYNEISYKEGTIFNIIAEKIISSCDETEVINAFMRVIENIFSDKIYNWGRIVMLYTFIGVFTKYYIDNGYTYISESEIIKKTGDYIDNNLCEWITKQGGWASMDLFLHNTNYVEWKHYKYIGYDIFLTSMIILGFVGVIKFVWKYLV